MGKFLEALGAALTPLLHILNGLLPVNLVQDDPNGPAVGAQNWAGTLTTVLFAVGYLAVNHFPLTHGLAGLYLSVGIPALTIVLHQWGKPSAVSIVPR